MTRENTYTPCSIVLLHHKHLLASQLPPTRITDRTTRQLEVPAAANSALGDAVLQGSGEERDLKASVGKVAAMYFLTAGAGGRGGCAVESGGGGGGLIRVGGAAAPVLQLEGGPKALAMSL